MDINKIKTPAFLKELNIRQLDDLSEQIRAFILDQVSQSGGHLASNLGAVELTVALHYCFDAPEDRLLFDTGHQCLTHLILTGRSRQLAPLYLNSGNSASLSRTQSPYDVCDASNFSSALSYALGIAAARDLNKENYHIVTLIGDGAFSLGQSMETLKQIGLQKRRVIIILNDNGMTHFTSDSIVRENLSKVRNSRAYNGLKDGVKTALRKGKHGDEVIGKIHDLKERIKEPIIDSRFLKDFGFYYIGPVNGHDFRSMISAFETARKKDMPVVVHCLTSKGKGYPLAEEDASGKWDHVSAFDIRTGKARSIVPEGEISLNEFTAACIEKAMREDASLVTVAAPKSFDSHLDHLFMTYPERSFDLGPSQDLAADFAAGLALSGMKVFVSTDATLLPGAYDQLTVSLDGKKLPVLYAVRFSEQSNAAEKPLDISYLRTLKETVVAQGKDAAEIGGLVRAALNGQQLFLLCLQEGNIRKEMEENVHPIQIGSWDYVITRKSPELYIFSCGSPVKRIARIIQDNDLNYSLVNTRFLQPMDYTTLDAILAAGKSVYIYSQNDMNSGLASAIRDYASRKQIPVRLCEIGNRDHGKEDIGKLFDRIEKDRKQSG